MNQKFIRNLLLISGIFFSAIILTDSSGCAVIIPPTGGPRDTLPPVLVGADPQNFALNFTGNKIVFTFNEYVDLKEVHENLVTSPVPKSDPSVEVKLKTITVRLKDTLRPNTTYSLNFGKAIRDINEGNILKNFTYIFSTGSYVDSMEFSGRVLLAETGKRDSTLIVMLHTKTDDSAVAKERPRYFTRLDSAGNFRFRYLRPGTYAIYALKDESGLKEYTSKSQLFAFSDTPVVVQPNYTPVLLYAYNDTTGSVKHPKKTAAKPAAPAKKQEEKKRLVVQSNLENGLLDVLGNLIIGFQTPLKFFDSSKVRFTDEKFNDLSQYRFELDTTMKRITMHYKWAMDTRYYLIASKEFAEDTLGDRLLKTDTISFHTKRESDYGSLRLRFLNLDLKKNPMLEFIQSDQIKKTYVFGSSNIFFDKLFLPGDYELRILYDENKNGKWDPGEFFGKHKQPEIVQAIKQKLTVKSDWENEFDINL
ncbi:MAG TPA: Ig-like domain-containing domain [Puia sp.]|nr:Ig-like domain-containing domain [Puia sp.]